MPDAVVGLLDNSAHISIYRIATWHTRPWRVAWPGAYIASKKRPAPKKSPAIRDLIFCAHSYTAEGLEFLDTPLHIHVHVVTIHECEIIMMVLIASVREIMV